MKKKHVRCNRRECNLNLSYTCEKEFRNCIYAEPEVKSKKEKVYEYEQFSLLGDAVIIKSKSNI